MPKSEVAFTNLRKCKRCKRHTPHTFYIQKYSFLWHLYKYKVYRKCDICGKIKHYDHKFQTP